MACEFKRFCGDMPETTAFKIFAVKHERKANCQSLWLTRCQVSPLDAQRRVRGYSAIVNDIHPRPNDNSTPRGPTLPEISYALAEIPKEIWKSRRKSRNLGEILEIFEKSWKSLRNLGNLREILEIFEKSLRNLEIF